MKIFYNTGFKGHWPVGTAAVVVASSAEEAAVLLTRELGLITLPQAIEPNSMIELEMKPQVVVLADGNY